MFKTLKGRMCTRAEKVLFPGGTNRPCVKTLVFWYMVSVRRVRLDAKQELCRVFVEKGMFPLGSPKQHVCRELRRCLDKGVEVLNVRLDKEVTKTMLEKVEAMECDARGEEKTFVELAAFKKEETQAGEKALDQAMAEFIKRRWPSRRGRRPYVWLEEGFEKPTVLKYRASGLGVGKGKANYHFDAHPKGRPADRLVSVVVELKVQNTALAFKPNNMYPEDDNAAAEVKDPKYNAVVFPAKLQHGAFKKKVGAAERVVLVGQAKLNWVLRCG